MLTRKRRVLARAVICPCIAGSGGVVGTTHGHVTHERRHATPALTRQRNATAGSSTNATGASNIGVGVRTRRYRDEGLTRLQ
jgi:hypothetical protein